MDALGHIVGRLAREMFGLVEFVAMFMVALLVFPVFAGRFPLETPDISFESAIGVTVLAIGLVGWVRLFKRLGTRLRLLLRGRGRA